MVKKPTEILEEEHHIIQAMVGVMAALGEDLEKGKDIEPGILRDVIEFMQVFGDKCHHGKEENHLFPLLEKKGVPVNGCPLGILVHDHQSARKLVTDLASAGDAYEKEAEWAREVLRASLNGLVNLYPGHIWKEDYLLFPMTDKILTSEEQHNLLEKFELVEMTIGKDVHQRFEQMVEKLTGQVQPL